MKVILLGATAACLLLTPNGVIAQQPASSNFVFPLGMGNTGVFRIPADADELQVQVELLVAGESRFSSRRCDPAWAVRDPSVLALVKSDPHYGAWVKPLKDGITELRASFSCAPKLNLSVPVVVGAAGIERPFAPTAEGRNLYPAKLEVHPPNSVNISGGRAIVGLDEKSVQIIATTRNPEGELIYADQFPMKWSVSNPGVLSIEKTYDHTAFFNPVATGTTTVTASVEGISQSFDVTVQQEAPPTTETGALAIRTSRVPSVPLSGRINTAVSGTSVLTSSGSSGTTTASPGTLVTDRPKAKGGAVASNSVEARTPPAGLSIIPDGPGKTRVRWTPAATAQKHTLLRSEAASGPFIQVGSLNNALSSAPPSSTELTDAHLYPGATYYYKVVATYGDPSDASESAIVAGVAGTNGQPGDLKAVSGLGFVSLSWSPVPGAVGYAVMRDDGKLLPQELLPANLYPVPWYLTFAYKSCEDKVTPESLISGATVVDNFEGNFLTFSSKPCAVKYVREVPGTKTYTVVPFFNVHGKLMSGPNGTPPKVAASPRAPSAVQSWHLGYDGKEVVVSFDRGTFGAPHWLMRAKVADLQFQKIAVLEDSPPVRHENGMVAVTNKGIGRFVDQNPPPGANAYKIVYAPLDKPTAETDVRTVMVTQYPAPVIGAPVTSLRPAGGNPGKIYDVRVSVEPLPGAETVVRIYKHEAYCTFLGTRIVLAKEVVVPANTRADVTFDTEPIYGFGALESNFVWVRAEATYNWGNTPGSTLKRTASRYMLPQKDPPDWNAQCHRP